MFIETWIKETKACHVAMALCRLNNKYVYKLFRDVYCITFYLAIQNQLREHSLP